MAVRTKKTPKRRKTKKAAVHRRKSPKKATSVNKEAHLKAYRALQKRVDKAWAKLQADVKRKASPSVLIRNKNQLLLLLGECNYMARECMRCSKKK